jgi:coenzyme F420-reducing hydrogenase alpha subunit
MATKVALNASDVEKITQQISALGGRHRAVGVGGVLAGILCYFKSDIIQLVKEALEAAHVNADTTNEIINALTKIFDTLCPVTFTGDSKA